MILTKEEFLQKLQDFVGDDTSDETMGFLEDMTDTYNDLADKAAGTDDSEWEEKYKALDKEWREKYKARFFASEETTEEETEAEEEETEAEDFDDLFEESEEK